MFIHKRGGIEIQMAERAKADFDVVWDLVRQSIEDSHELSDTALNLWF